MTTTKIFFSSNLRFLRERKKHTQEEFAEMLDLSRNKLQALESGKTVNPAIVDIINFSEYFKVSVDTLLKVDLCKLSELKLRELEAGNDIYVTGSKLRVLAITSDERGNENIEYVPVKAKAGYVAGHNDPEYINTLPKFRMPQLPKNKTFRMFPITGDSMLPFEEGDCIIAEYVDDWLRIKDNTLCILIIKGNQDLVFKQVTNRLKDDQELTLSSLNEVYEPYTVKAADLLEVWKYHSHWTAQVPENTNGLRNVSQKLIEIQSQIQQLSKT